MIRLIIVDDDSLVAESLKTILNANENMEVLQTGRDGSDAIALYEEYNPDVLLVDIQMKEISGLEASRAILEKYKDAQILLLTTFSDDEYIVKALQIGCKGYLLKQDYESIVPAIEAVFSGQTVFGTEIIQKIPALLAPESSFDYAAKDINERELEIIKLIADGLSNKEIAARLFLSEGTVRNYLSSILDKLELRDRTQVAIFYYQH